MMAECERCGQKLAKVTAKHRDSMACQTGTAKRRALADGLQIVPWSELKRLEELGLIEKRQTRRSQGGWGQPTTGEFEFWAPGWALDTIVTMRADCDARIIATLRLAAASRANREENAP